MQMKGFLKKFTRTGTSLALQWLGLRTSIAGGSGSIPGRWGPRIPRAAKQGQKTIYKDKLMN